MMKPAEKFQYGLAVIIIIGYFTLLIYLVYKGGNDDLVYLVVGTLLGVFTAVTSYYFGSSKGSAEKGERQNVFEVQRLEMLEEISRLQRELEKQKN